MPSPVGHALAGVVAGCLVAAPGVRLQVGARVLRAFERISVPRDVCVFGALGMLPDVDFLFGSHSTYTHSVGAVVAVGVVGSLLVVGRGVGIRLRYGVGVAAAYGSHVLLDWLGTDDTAPFGVMALWPMSERFFVSDRQWFYSVCRQVDEFSCWLHNLRGVGWELALLGPLAIAALLLSGRR